MDISFDILLKWSNKYSQVILIAYFAVVQSQFPIDTHHPNEGI